MVVVGWVVWGVGVDVGGKLVVVDVVYVWFV